MGPKRDRYNRVWLCMMEHQESINFVLRLLWTSNKRMQDIKGQLSSKVLKADALQFQFSNLFLNFWWKDHSVTDAWIDRCISMLHLQSWKILQISFNWDEDSDSPLLRLFRRINWLTVQYFVLEIYHNWTLAVHGKIYLYYGIT